MNTASAGYVELTLKYEREGGQWVGVCLELSTSTYAKTLEQVQSTLPRLVIEHLDLLDEAGERARFFEEHGIRFHSVKPEPQTMPIPSIDLPREEMGPFFQPGLFRIELPEEAALHA